eukprot:EG_transcript_39900
MGHLTLAHQGSIVAAELPFARLQCAKLCLQIIFNVNEKSYALCASFLTRAYVVKCIVVFAAKKLISQPGPCAPRVPMMPVLIPSSLTLRSGAVTPTPCLL